MKEEKAPKVEEKVVSNANVTQLYSIIAILALIVIISIIRALS